MQAIDPKLQDRSLTKAQKRVMGFWVGGPLIVMLLFLVIAPGYANGYFVGFSEIGGGMGVILALTFFNWLALITGFRFLKRRALTYLLITVTFVICTLPTYFLVVFWPSMMKVMTVELPPDFPSGFILPPF